MVRHSERTRAVYFTSGIRIQIQDLVFFIMTVIQVIHKASGVTWLFSFFVQNIERNIHIWILYKKNKLIN